MRQNKFWLKLVGTALLVHVILIALSIIEVAFYSYVIETGKDEAFYSQHANESGPWVSAIGGSLLMFLLVKRYVRRFTDRQLTYAIMLPVVYIAIDMIILAAANVNIIEHMAQLLPANAVKIAAALVAYYLYKPKKDSSG